MSYCYSFPFPIVSRCEPASQAEARVFFETAGFDQLGLVHGRDWELVASGPNPAAAGGWSLAHARFSRSTMRRAQAEYLEAVGDAQDRRLENHTPWYLWAYGAAVFVEEANYNVFFGKANALSFYF